MARDEDVMTARQAMRMAPRRAQIPQTAGTPQGLVAPERSGLVVEGLRKSYKRRPVVRDVSFSVRRGEAVGLLGPNGAGKTTVFYMITGLVAADSGKISLDGVEITICRCTGGPVWELGIWRRRVRFSAASLLRKTFAPCLN